MANPVPTTSSQCVIVNDTINTPKPLTDGQKRMLAQRRFKRRMYPLQHANGEPIRYQR
jgi:hypothetical protein